MNRHHDAVVHEDKVSRLLLSDHWLSFVKYCLSWREAIKGHSYWNSWWRGVIIIGCISLIWHFCFHHTCSFFLQIVVIVALLYTVSGRNAFIPSFSRKATWRSGWEGSHWSWWIETMPSFQHCRSTFLTALHFQYTGEQVQCCMK